MPQELFWKFSDLDINDLISPERVISEEQQLCELESYLADCISDETGYFIKDYDYEFINDGVRIFDIIYDVDGEEAE